MMRTTPRSFYELFVVPNYWDYLEAPDDARRGFNASVSAFQMADVFYAFYSREDPELLKPWPTLKSLHIHLASRERYFSIIQSVATVYKHLYAKGGHYLVGSPAAVWGVSIPNEDVELESDWQDSKMDLFVRLRDKTRVSLSLALQKVVEDMWPSFLPDEDEFHTNE